jgi:hypothetical protein
VVIELFPGLKRRAKLKSRHAAEDRHFKKIVKSDRTVSLYIEDQEVYSGNSSLTPYGWLTLNPVFGIELLLPLRGREIAISKPP